MRIVNPYEGVTGPWLKGQLHAHSTNSDGSDPPHEVARAYERLGFDFLSLTDHNTVPDDGDLDVDVQMVLIRGMEYRCGVSEELGLSGLEEAPPDGLEHAEALAAALGTGAFVVFNHPTWHIHHWPIYRMLKLGGAHALEVYNAVVEWLPGAAECADKWDRLLTCGLRIFGIASDDAHHAPQRGMGWVMVSAERSGRDIIEALKSGRFYASSGLRVDSVTLEGDLLTIESADADEIRFYADRGSMRHRQAGPRACYRIQERDIYVRAELYGAGPAKAWLQPLFVQSEASRRQSEEFRNWYLAQQPLIASW